MGSLSAIFKAYDVRGIVPEQWDVQEARAIGAAFARFVSTPRVLIARDMRLSSPRLSRAFAEGVVSVGVQVTDLGLASTDLLYFASGYLDLPAAMFTASHNPATYNGIKMCLSGARPIGVETGLSAIEQMAEEELKAGPKVTVDLGEAKTNGILTELDLLNDYASHVRSFVNLSSLRPLRIVVDTANGMGGLVVPKVMESLPFQLTILFRELDGNFPNHPADPIQPENLASLKEAVLSSSADIGLAFDGDADRVFLVDERAEGISGSLTTALVALSLLKKHPGATVLYNAICSRVVPEVIAENGGTEVRTRVGHSFIKKVMAETGAVFGGEHSGHYYFRDNYRADSGLIAALIVLELISQSSKSLSELLSPLRRYVDSGEINVAVYDPQKVIEAVKPEVARTGARLDYLDGLTADYEDWWFNIRPSNTEPLLRINVEARTEQECEEHSNWVQRLVKAADTTLRSSIGGGSF